MAPGPSAQPKDVRLDGQALRLNLPFDRRADLLGDVLHFLDGAAECLNRADGHDQDRRGLDGERDVAGNLLEIVLDQYGPVRATPIPRPVSTPTAWARWTARPPPSMD